MAESIADLLVKTLAQAGVQRIWGVTGDSLNGINDSIRRDGRMTWMHVRHEEAAAFAAGAEAAITGELAVCAGSCGPGNLHLINGLFDCQRNHVPVLAIASHIPSSEIGLGYFQETHPQALFQECSDFVELVSNPAQMPEVLHRALNTAVGRKGVAVLVIPGDVSLARAPERASAHWVAPRQPRLVPAPADVEAIADLLKASKATTILAGSGCAAAHDELVELAQRIKAPVVHAMRGKEWVEWDNPCDVGMTGLIGFASGYHALMNSETVLMLGTDFPYRPFYPDGATIIQVDRRPEALGKRAPLALGVVADVGETLRALLSQLPEVSERRFLDNALKDYGRAREGLDELASPSPPGRPIHPQYLTQLVSEIADDDAIFTADVGTPTVWAARYLKMNGRRRLLGSFNHGSMANAMLQAMGAQAAAPGRQVVSLSGDGGLTMMLGELLTVVQLKLPLKLVIYNNGTLGFVAMEMKAAGYLDFATDLENPDFAAMAETLGIRGYRVQESEALESTLRSAFAEPGPVLVDVVTAKQELAMPPRIKAEQARGFSLFMLKAILSGRGDEIRELVRTNLLR